MPSNTNRGYQVQDTQTQDGGLHNQGSPLSAQQYAAVQKAAGERVRAMMDDMKLRQWAVSEAARVAPGSVVEMARAIHAFLTEPAKDQP